MKILYISNFNFDPSHIEQDYDIIFHIGNATQTGSKEEIQKFSNWFKSLKAPMKIFVPGEKDKLFYSNLPSSFHWLDKSIKVIFNNVFEYQGVKFWCHSYIQRDLFCSSGESLHKTSSYLRKIFSNFKFYEIDVLVSTHSGFSNSIVSPFINSKSVLFSEMKDRAVQMHIFSKGSFPKEYSPVKYHKISSSRQMTLEISDFYYIDR